MYYMKITHLLTVVFCGAVLGFATTAAAQTFDNPAPLDGYAWSPNVGWISFQGDNYGVAINPDSTLTGYAWSPNVGWIDFGSQSGCPTGSCDPQVDFDTNTFSGWARALNYGHGWDGWISLGGSNHGSGTYGIEVTSSGGFTPSSYAWGSDVVGWMNFSTTYISTPCGRETTCTADETATQVRNIWCELEPEVACSAGWTCDPSVNSCVQLTGDLMVDPPLIRRGDEVTVTWETEPGVYDSCRVTGPGGPWSGVQNTDGVTAPNVNANGATFILFCTPAGGGTEVKVDTESVRMIPLIYES